MNQQKVKIIIILLLIAFPLIVFWQVQNFEFILYDDPVYVTNNAHVKAGLTIESLKWAFMTNYAGFWHPLTWLSLMLDYEIYCLNPGGYHWTNLLFHIACVILLFTALNLMTGAVWRCAMVSVLFAVHPLHVESVAWVSERKDVLSAFFWMLTLISYAYYVKKRTLGKFALVFFNFVMGMMAKPMLITLPFVLLLLDFWPLKRFQIERPEGVKNSGGRFSGLMRLKPAHGESLSMIIAEKIPFIILSIILTIVTFLAEKQFGALSSLQELSLAARLSNAMVAYSSYLLKMLWPLKLSFFYPHPGVWPSGTIGFSLIFLIFATSLFVKFASKYPYCIVGWLWYLGSLIPVIGLVQVGSHAIADRYTYIPLIGIFIIISWGIADLVIKKRPVKLPAIALNGFVVILMAVAMVFAHSQVGYWRDNTTLFKHALEVTDANYIGHNNLAAVLRKTGQYDAAIQHLYDSVRIKPDFDIAYYNLGLAMSAKGMNEEALVYYEKALHFKPDYIEIYYDIEATLLRLGKIQHIPRFYKRALVAHPNNVELKNKLGISLARIGLHEEAAGKFKEVVGIRPNFAGAYNNLGMELFILKRYDDARLNFQKALMIQPEYANAHYYLAVILKKQGFKEEADKHYQKAVSINYVYKNNNFAYVSN